MRLLPKTNDDDVRIVRLHIGQDERWFAIPGLVLAQVSLIIQANADSWIFAVPEIAAAFLILLYCIRSFRWSRRAQRRAEEQRQRMALLRHILDNNDPAP